MHGWGVSTRAGRWVLALAVIVLLSPARAPGGQAAEGAERLALVIGNSAYVSVSPLPNPKNDAADVGAALGIVHVESSPLTRSSYHAGESASAVQLGPSRHHVPA